MIAMPAWGNVQYGWIVNVAHIWKANSMYVYVSAAETTHQQKVLAGKIGDRSVSYLT